MTPGPARPMASPLPKKSPVPMAPPTAIIVSCRGVSRRLRPASRRRTASSCSWLIGPAAKSSLRLGQGAGERWPERVDPRMLEGTLPSPLDEDQAARFGNDLADDRSRDPPSLELFQDKVRLIRLAGYDERPLGDRGVGVHSEPGTDLFDLVEDD